MRRRHILLGEPEGLSDESVKLRSLTKALKLFVRRRIRGLLALKEIADYQELVGYKGVFHTTLQSGKYILFPGRIYGLRPLTTGIEIVLLLFRANV